MRGAIIGTCVGVIVSVTLAANGPRSLAYGIVVLALVIIAGELTTKRGPK